MERCRGLFYMQKCKEKCKSKNDKQNVKNEMLKIWAENIIIYIF